MRDIEGKPIKLRGKPAEFTAKISPVPTLPPLKIKQSGQTDSQSLSSVAFNATLSKRKPTSSYIICLVTVLNMILIASTTRGSRIYTNVFIGWKQWQRLG